MEISGGAILAYVRANVSFFAEVQIGPRLPVIYRHNLARLQWTNGFVREGRRVVEQSSKK